MNMQESLQFDIIDLAQTALSEVIASDVKKLLLFRLQKQCVLLRTLIDYFAFQKLNT